MTRRKKKTNEKTEKFLLGAAALFLGVTGTAAVSFPAYADGAMGAVYRAHIHGRGWTDMAKDNTYVNGPRDTYVTAVAASLENQPEGMTGTIAYQGELKRLRLDGLAGEPWRGRGHRNRQAPGGCADAAHRPAFRKYDLYYSVLQNGSWTGLVRNGETAGVEGQGLRVDGIRIAVTGKDAGLPPEGIHMGRYIDPSKPMVALTFDDGPSAHTARILDCLEANDARATFYMVGNRMGTYQSAVKRSDGYGLRAGSHTWDHTYITKLSQEGLFANLNRLDDTLQSIAGVRTVTMRPPGGFVSDGARQNLAKKGVPAILWSIDTLDWKTKNAQNTINVVLSSVKDGDIILMHDLYGTSADAAVVLIPELKKRGYQLVTVSEMASLRGGMTPGQVYHSFRP